MKLRRTDAFDQWFRALRDVQGRARIAARIERLAEGNPGKHRILSGGVCELKIDHGQGYRVYYIQHGDVLIILLCGGNKSTQRADIALARRLAGNL